MLTVLDLFSGIGGFSYGLERTGGFKTVAFCEIDPFARRVLAKHWPGVPIYEDVTTLSRDRLSADGLAGVDVVCGGFPCQDISTSGLGAGISGERSGLWFEFHRIIKETKPDWVIIENVAVLRSRGLEAILWGINEIGYDAEWHCIPASAVGAPHQRDRLWIIAYSKHRGRGLPYNDARGNAESETPSLREGNGSLGLERIFGLPTGNEIWSREPGMDRVANGVPRGLDRNRVLGNAVVPPIPEMLGRAILAQS